MLIDCLDVFWIWMFFILNLMFCEETVCLYHSLLLQCMTADQVTNEMQWLVMSDKIEMSN